MKRTISFILLAIVLVTMASAQGWVRSPGHGENQRRMPAAETVTVSGALAVSNGMPAVKSGDTNYLVGRILRLSGFIDGLKEGAQVTIEGRAFSAPGDGNVKILMPSKLTLAGKTYDVAPERRNFTRAFPQVPKQFGNNQYRRNFKVPPRHSPKQPEPSRRRR
jgi:hypothetical protein